MKTLIKIIAGLISIYLPFWNLSLIGYIKLYISVWEYPYLSGLVENKIKDILLKIDIETVTAVYCSHTANAKAGILKLVIYNKGNYSSNELIVISYFIFLNHTAFINWGSVKSLIISTDSNKAEAGLINIAASLLWFEGNEPTLEEWTRHIFPSLKKHQNSKSYGDLSHLFMLLARIRNVSKYYGRSKKPK